MISLLVLACMEYSCGFLVMIYHWHGGIPGLTMDLLSVAISWIVTVLWVYFLFFLVIFHVPLVVGSITSSWKPWFDKCSGSPVTTWVESLVLEALVGKMTWKPLVG